MSRARFKRSAILLILLGAMSSARVALGEPRRTEEISGQEGAPFEDLAPAGGLLIGVKITSGFLGPWGVISSIQPIYRTADGEKVFGAVHGHQRSSVLSVEAKTGYAVGAIESKAGGRVDGLRCIFFHRQGTRLNPKKSYEGRWLGAAGPGGSKSLAGDGAPVIGIFGRAGDDLSSIGLIQEPAGVDK
jgi:hypothetical protein